MSDPSRVRPDPPPQAGATPAPDIERALIDLEKGARRWQHVDVPERVRLLARLSHGIRAVADRWALAVVRAEGLAPESPEAGEEWLVGPYLVLRHVHLLRRALIDVEDAGSPKIPGPIGTRPSGQVVAQVFPESTFDTLFYPGTKAEVWMRPGVTRDELIATQASAYRRAPSRARRVLVLGGGNVSSIGPLDVLTKLFVDNTVALLKLHPVNAYLAPVFEEAFAPLLEADALRVVQGGADVGARLCEDPRVDEIHVTGSESTFEAIVFGTGDEGRRRKEAGERKLDKPVTGELGNVSPVVVVPGPWSRGDLRYQAENIASMVVNNAGFNCNAARVLIQHAGWPQAESLLDELRRVFASQRPRPAFYPGARERHARFLEAHPGAERIGDPGEEALPWTLIPGLDPDARDEICFETEAFCSVVAETRLPSHDAAAFLEGAVAFCNERLSGTLNATILVHPRSRRDPAVARALERALGKLRYGTVCVNHWAALGYGLGVTPWGAFPGHDPTDVQSGIGVVHNTLMFEKPEKSVIRTPFRALPKPPWFVGHRRAHRLARLLAEFEARPRLSRLPRIALEALRGGL
jgi:acyl-CoA reductase-like NAD-dependent aldehyde dehydrogenase